MKLIRRVVCDRVPIETISNIFKIPVDLNHLCLDIVCFIVRIKNTLGYS